LPLAVFINAVLPIIRRLLQPCHCLCTPLEYVIRCLVLPLNVLSLLCSLSYYVDLCVELPRHVIQLVAQFLAAPLLDAQIFCFLFQTLRQCFHLRLQSPDRVAAPLAHPFLGGNREVCGLYYQLLSVKYQPLQLQLSSLGRRAIFPVLLEDFIAHPKNTLESNDKATIIKQYITSLVQNWGIGLGVSLEISGPKVFPNLVASKFWGQKLLSIWSLQNFGANFCFRVTLLRVLNFLSPVAPSKSPPTSTFSKHFFQLSTTFTHNFDFHKLFVLFCFD
jgi:hypothetical protein